MKFKIIVLILVIILLISCSRNIKTNQPNVILIMVDDMGYECLSTYGNLDYQTPFLDSLANNGIKFNNCISQPLCTPSRVKIMSGLYNYKNYEHFGYLNDREYTFGNLMKDAGYTTCISGKWQLNGLAYKDSIKNWNDKTRAKIFGFDEYCLWQYTKTRAEGERYSQPLIEQNGIVLSTNKDDYGPDIFSNFILNFIDSNKNNPFFIYYPMVLVHDPFVPTPDSDVWNNPDLKYKNDTTYFKDMVIYVDKIVKKIVMQLRKNNLEENTLILFTGDNGNHTSIYTNTKNGIIQGGKGNTTDAGTHVPLIAYWPSKIKNNIEYNGLIDFCDFMPTLADLVNRKVESDGVSFYNLLMNKKHNQKDLMFLHYDPKWGKNVNKYRNQFARNVDYKLYRDGRFINLKKDILEENPLEINSLSNRELLIYQQLNEELRKHPPMLNKTNFVK